MFQLLSTQPSVHLMLMNTMVEFTLRLDKRLTMQLTLFLRTNIELIVNMNSVNFNVKF